MTRITAESINRMLSGSDITEEIMSLLNGLIDDELAKADDDMDFDLIDECTSAIIEIESNGEITAEALYEMLRDKSLVLRAGRSKIKYFSGTGKALILVAAIVLSTITASAAIGDFSLTDIVKHLSSNEEIITTLAPTQAKPSSTAPASTTTTRKEKTTSTTRKQQTEATISRYKGTTRAKKKKPAVRRESSISETQAFILYDDFNEKEYLESNYSSQEDTFCEVSGSAHSFSEWKTTKASTCAHRGEKTRACRDCGRVQSCPIRKKSKHICTLSGVIKPASASSSGKLEYRCNACKSSFSKELPRIREMVLDSQRLTYNGKKQTPRVEYIIDYDGHIIDKSLYRISYPDASSECAGGYTVVAELDGEYYEGRITAHYSISPVTVRIDKVSMRDGGIYIKWSKSSLINASNASGYELQYGFDKSFRYSGMEKIKDIGKASYYIEDAESDARYYIRMRVYYHDTEEGEDIYSEWSDTVAIDIV